MIVIAFILCMFWLYAMSTVYDRLRLNNVFGHTFLVLSAIIAVWLSQPDLWQSAAAFYPGDSFFDLNWFGRTGVLTISALSILALYALMAWQTRFFKKQRGGAIPAIALLCADIGVGAITFAILYTMSPQIYYTFYQLIFPDLPTQVVIKGIINFEQVHRVAQLAPGDSLSNHLSGLAFLGIIPFKVLLFFRMEDTEKELNPGSAFFKDRTSMAVHIGIAACLAILYFVL